MTDTADRMGKLDDLYDHACEVLADTGATSPESRQERVQIAQWVIDRWLQQQEADRKYELQPKIERIQCDWRTTDIASRRAMVWCILDKGHSGVHTDGKGIEFP
jgi:hypothetical protein